MAERTLSIYLNTDRIYLVGVRVENNRAMLDYIESTDHHIDLENLQNEESKNALLALEKILSGLEFKPDKTTITLPAESIFITKFPAKSSYTKEQLRQLVNLELRQAYPKFNYDNFEVMVSPIYAPKSKKESMIGMIILKSDLEFIKSFFEKFNLKISNFEISQLAAYSSFMFNYPEMREKTIMIIGYQGKFLDFTVHQNGQTLYYNINSIDDPSLIGEATEKEYAKIQETAIDEVDACYFYGSSLTRNITLSLWETGMVLGIMEAKRLNPFRMMGTNLDKRHLEYCSRTFQIYPPCVGSGLKKWHTLINI